MNQRTPLLALAGIAVLLQTARASVTTAPCSDESCKNDAKKAAFKIGENAAHGAVDGLEIPKSGKNGPEGTDATSEGVGATGKGLSEGLSGAVGKNLGTPKMGTADEVPTAAVLADIAAAAKSAAASSRFPDVILNSAKGVMATLQREYPEPKMVPANNIGAFQQMLAIQLDENRQLRALMHSALPPEERAKAKKTIEDAATRRMESEVSGKEIRSSFTLEYTQAKEQWRADHKDSGELPAGPPSRSRIGGLLRGDPGNRSILTLDGMEKLASGDKAGGRAALDRAISLGGTPDAYALRGGMRLDSNDFDGAYQDAKKALGMNPGDKNAMGVLKSAEGRTSPGLASSPAAGGGAPSGGSGAGGGAGFASGGFSTGRTREIPGMTAASTLASDQKLEEARRAMAMGDFQAADALAQQALKLNPSNAGAHDFLSRIYAERGDYTRSLAAASAGLALAPRDGELLNRKAFAQNRTKQYRAALETSFGAIEAAPRNPKSYANRGYAYGGLGDKAAMVSDMNSAASLDPAYKKAAADAAALQLPSNADILFMFPGENPPEAHADAAPAKGRSFGLVVGAGVLGGLLLALGLLSTVLAPLKDSVVSAFTKVTRHGPSVHALDEEATPEPASAEAASGVIQGQYEIVRQIGAGGMGMVYEGTDRSLGRRVAIKKMRDELRFNPREKDRFIIEAKTVASLHHPNIVDIYAIAEEGEDVYLVFEYVDGKTVHDLVQAKGRLNPSDTRRVTRAMGDALTYAHAHGVIHRDMKPSNVMVTPDGGIKVMDFGIARMAKDALTRYSMTNTVVGTPPYMAPEQEQGVVRKESDVYSLAVCAYEMLTGKMPFVGIGAGMLMNKINMSYTPPSRAIAGLPESLDEVFLKAFQADPDQRYHAPQEFVAALEEAFGGARSSAKPV